MKRPTIAVLLVGLLLAPVLTGSATAAAPRKVATKLYFHSPDALGEISSIFWVASTFGEDPLTMDTVKPTAKDSKSMSYEGYVNDQCTGVPFYPTFVGKLDGTIDSPLTVDLHSLSLPGTYTANLWVDTPVFQCNLQNEAPASSVTFDLPAGQSELKVTIPRPLLRHRSAHRQITIMVFAPTAPTYRGQVGRLYYDSAAQPSSLSFSCLPRAGSRRCTP